MSSAGAIRASLRSNPYAYRVVYAFRNQLLNYRIGREQRRLERRAVALGLPCGEEPPRQVFQRLAERLALRGITWPPQPRGRPLHILYASTPGNWERHNLPPELAKLGEVSCYFLSDEGISWKDGWEKARGAVDGGMPAFVQELHRRKPVDLMLSYLSGAQISPVTIEAIGQLGIPTFSFHLDDRRAFYGRKIGGQWSGPAAVCRSYDLNLTNALASLVKYRALGANVLFWPEGAGTDFFQPLDLPEKYDVTFCGQRYGIRPLLVDFLRKNGIRVDCFGEDWEHGYVNDKNLVTIFNQSRVNLGFGYVNESSDQCLKGRDFEVPACGALYLTSYNENLPRVYQLGEEIETYRTFTDCLAQIKSLLADNARRAKLRSAARSAVLRHHSWSARIQQLIAGTGCPFPKSN